VNIATQQCASAAPAAVASQATQPNWDQLANSFASLSAAFAWGSILLALIAVGAGIGWGFYVKHWAEREAREEATKCVKVLMDKWLAEEAPQLIRQSVELLQNTSLGSTDDGEAADEMGEEAG
jgi:hypothetical protein